MAINTFSGGNFINSLQAAGKNAVINGGMDIWQRGTSFTGSTTAFGADRWQAYRNTTGSTFSRQTTSDTTNLPNIQYCIRAQRNSGDTATNGIWVSQTLESVNSIPFAGKTVTLSFYARAGANFSSASSALTVVLASGTGTDQNIFSGFTGNANVVNTTATLTTTWQRFTFTGTVATTATQLATYTVYTPVGTAGANDYYEITGVQLELGTTATTFSRAGGTIQGELAACQRYYYQHIDANDKPVMNAGYFTAAILIGIIPLPVTMRTSPTISVTNGSIYWVSYSNGAADTFDTLGFGIVNPTAVNVEGTGNVSGTSGYAANIRSYNAGSRLGMSAEL